MLLDTYRTFGCESGDPTFRYSLLNGVEDEFLINPYVVDARTEITTQLLSDEGYTVEATNEDGNEAKETFGGRDFEKKFFATATNEVFCRTFLLHGLRIHDLTGDLHGEIRLVATRPDLVCHFIEDLGQLRSMILAYREHQ